MELSDVKLRQLSDNLGVEWQKLASFLHFSQPKIEQFLMDSTQWGIENSIFNMLVSWRERQSVKSTNFRKELRDALVKCGRRDLAESILEDSPKALLDQIYASLCSKLETKPELFEEAVKLFYKGYVSMETDSQLAAAMAAFGQSDQGKQGAQCTNVQGKDQEVEKIALKKWRKSLIINPRNESDENFKCVGKIAIHPSGDIAFIDRVDIIYEGKRGSRVYAFNQDGTPTFVLNSEDDKPAGELCNAAGIAVTNDGKYVIADGTTKVKVFDSAGQYLEHFTTLSDDVRKDVKASARSITVNPSNGDVLVGDFRREMITVHDGRDFKIKEEVYVDLIPHDIAVNSKNQIFVTLEVLVLLPALRLKVGNKEGGKVVAFNYDGDSLFTIVPMLGGEPARPIGIVCDSNDGLYISVMKFDIESFRSKENTGHIHYYNSEGQFIKCVVKGLFSPRGVTLINGFLAVADKKSAIIYKPD